MVFLIAKKTPRNFQPLPFYYSVQKSIIKNQSNKKKAENRVFATLIENALEK
jgi:hypothetical protein